MTFVQIVLKKAYKPACVTTCHTDALYMVKKQTILRDAEKRLAKVKERYPNAKIYNPARN